MSQTEVIREFLVQLGYKVDEHGAKKFRDMLSTGTKDALKMGGAVIGVASAIEIFTNEMAKAGESLYFISQRSRASVANLQAVGYAAAGIGSSAEEATSAIEGLSAFMRNTPGAESYLNSLRIQTRGVNGELLDTNDILKSTTSQLNKLPWWLERQYGQQLNIPENYLLQRRLNGKEDARLEEDHLRRLKDAGIQVDSLNQKEHEYRNGWRLLIDDIDIFGSKLESIAIGPATKLLGIMDQIVTGLTNHPLDNMYANRPILKEQTAEEYKKTGDDVKKSWSQGIKSWWNDITDIRVSRTYDEPFGPNLPNTTKNSIYGMWKALGYSDIEAAGMTAQAMAESGGRSIPSLTDPNSFGVYQLDAHRQAMFKAIMGKDIHDATIAEQVKYADIELHGTERGTLDMLRGASSAREAGIIATGFERPSDFIHNGGYNSPTAILRGDMADRIYRDNQASAPVINQTNNITVNGNSDPEKAAAEVGKQITRANQAVTRNVAGALM